MSWGVLRYHNPNLFAYSLRDLTETVREHICRNVEVSYTTRIRGSVGVWGCGGVGVRGFGAVGVWRCGSVGVWECAGAGA
jgi:hypothetical protein